MLTTRLIAKPWIRLQNYHKTINKHFQSANGERLRGGEDRNRYYDENEDSGLARNDGDEKEDISAYIEDEAVNLSDDEDEAVNFSDDGNED